jgi:hypothetical protein
VHGIADRLDPGRGYTIIRNSRVWVHNKCAEPRAGFEEKLELVSRPTQGAGLEDSGEIPWQTEGVHGLRRSLRDSGCIWGVGVFDNTELLGGLGRRGRFVCMGS